MAGYAGFDSSQYPGDHLMRLLWNQTNLEWAGFYLAPAPAHPNTQWMGKRSFLKDIGWGLAPIYLGQQSEGPGPKNLTSLQGYTDGNDAAALAQKAGFPGGSVIFLDIEQFGPPLSQGTKDYYKSWIDGICDSGYFPGVYCSSHLASHLASVSCFPSIWVYHIKYPKKTYQDPLPDPDPIASGCSRALAWQLAQDCTLLVKDDNGIVRNFHPIDFNSATNSDPSSFFPNNQPVTPVGRWEVHVGVWTWNYVFYRDYTCDWRNIVDPDAVLGHGTWLMDNLLRISWPTGAKEEWDLPLRRRAQTGTLIGQGKIIKARKLS